eukprot:5304325-Alexandrium_andersonii.AAC.1
MRASMVSMSRWFVGSSRYIRCGWQYVTIARATVGWAFGSSVKQRQCKIPVRDERTAPGV